MNTPTPEALRQKYVRHAQQRREARAAGNRDAEKFHEGCMQMALQIIEEFATPTPATPAAVDGLRVPDDAILARGYYHWHEEEQDYDLYPDAGSLDCKTCIPVAIVRAAALAPGQEAGHGEALEQKYVCQWCSGTGTVYQMLGRGRSERVECNYCRGSGTLDLSNAEATARRGVGPVILATPPARDSSSQANEGTSGASAEAVDEFRRGYLAGAAAGHTTTPSDAVIDAARQAGNTEGGA